MVARPRAGVAAIYARVSSLIQRDKHTIDSQLRVLPAFATDHGWQTLEPYVDDGRSARSGKLEKRDGLARLLRDAKAGLFDHVVVVDLDRLTRSEDIAERGMVIGSFQQAGVKIAVANSGQVLDLNTSIGDLQAVLGGFFAAEDNRKRIARVTQGRETSARKGRKPGGPTPFGYRYDVPTGVWSLHEVNAAQMRDAFRRVIAGESCRSIALLWASQGLKSPRGGPWTPITVWRMLTSEIYIGKWTADRKRAITVSVPPIVDDATWNAAQERIASGRKRGLRRTKHVYLLEGLAVCSVCGSKIYVRAAEPKEYMPSRYICKHRLYPPFGTPRCTLPIMRAEEIDAKIWTGIARMLSRPDLLDQALGRAKAKKGAARDSGAAWAADLKSWERKLAHLTRTEAEHLAMHRRGLVSMAALEVELGAIRREREAVERQVETTRRALASAERTEFRARDAEATFAAARAELAGATSAAARQIIVQRLVEPGSLVLGPDGVRFFVGLQIEPPAKSAKGGAASGGGARASHSVPPAQSSTMHRLRLRVVA